MTLVKFINEHKGHRVGDHLRWGVESMCTVCSEHGAAIAPSTYYDARAHTGLPRDFRIGSIGVVRLLVVDLYSRCGLPAGSVAQA